MAMIISHDQRNYNNDLEDTKGQQFADLAVKDFLYASPQDGSELCGAMEFMKHYKHLKDWTKSIWQNLLRKYFIKSCPVIVCGYPSQSLAEEVEKEENNLRKLQKKGFGDSALAAYEKATQKAMNNKEPPIEVLRNFQVPVLSDKTWPDIPSAQGNLTSAHGTGIDTKLVKKISEDDSPLPFFVQFDHFESACVTVRAVLSLSKLPNHLRPLIGIYMSTFFTLPVASAGKKELLYKMLDEETVLYDIELGQDNEFSETLWIRIKVEVEKLRKYCASVKAGFPDDRSDSDQIPYILARHLLYNDTSSIRAASLTSQMGVVPQLLADLQSSDQLKIRKIQKQLEEFRDNVTELSEIRFSVTGNIMHLKHPRKTFKNCFQGIIPKPSPGKTPQPSKIRLENEVLSALGHNPCRKVFVTTMPSIGSSNALLCTKSIQGFNNIEYPAFCLAMKILNTFDGYLWKAIRDKGYGYTPSIDYELGSGLLNLVIYRSTNTAEAIKGTKALLDNLIKHPEKLKDTTVEAAKSSLVFNTVNNTSFTLGTAAFTSFVNQALKNVSRDQHKRLLKDIQKVTKDEVLKSMKKYCLPLFNPETSAAIILTVVTGQNSGLRLEIVMIIDDHR
ncbi:hypothetical protein DFH11DRAFT_1798615 [Phellopilus nigrolimitatus]|nr:hypothetical protein DFH11DRAFT_1798615 [Phellopilus nigrolimitatus]